MVNAINYLGGKYVRADQLPTERRVAAVIVAVVPETMELSGDEPLVLTLRSTTGQAWPKKFVLNTGNNQTLIDAFGAETDTWIGQTIEAWQEPVKFGAKWVPGKKIAALNGRGAAQPVIEARPVPTPPLAAKVEIPADRRTPTPIGDGHGTPMPDPTPEPRPPGGGDLDDDSIPWAACVQ